MPLFNLRARYSRALCRASFQLRFHADGSAPISTDPLLYLLDSISLAGRCERLLPDSHTSLGTHQPQSKKNRFPEFQVHVFGSGAWHYLNPTDIGDKDGLRVGLLGILGSDQIETTLGLELAAGRALATFAPMLLSQWLRMIPEDHVHRDKEALDFARGALEDWPSDLDADLANELVDWTTEQLLIIATIAVSLAGRPGIRDLPERALLALYRRAKLLSGRSPTWRTLDHHTYLVESLIRFTDINYPKLSQAALRLFFSFFSLRHFQG